jgi:SsrA-binding protein
MKIIAQNKKAYFDYEITETLEAGVVLTGDEVKALRAGHVRLVGSYATIHDGELFIINCHITPYEKAYRQREDLATRSRKLLIHRRELNRLVGDISQKGVTIIPLKIYFNNRNKVKIELGIGKHKKAVSKKATIKERDIKRQTQRELKNVYKY